MSESVVVYNIYTALAKHRRIGVSDACEVRVDLTTVSLVHTRTLAFVENSYLLVSNSA